MAAYNFQARFAEAVATGRKTQTIRATREGRSRHAKPGEPIQLYTGLRTMKHPKHSSDYWQMGYNAAWRGKKRTSNPYPMRKADVRGPAWDEGWRSANLSIELGYLKPKHGERRAPPR